MSTVLVVAALVAAAVLVFQTNDRLFPVLALLAAGVEALLRFGIISLSIQGVSLWLVLGVLLLIAGAIAWTRASGKIGVSAATVVAAVGALQVASVLT